MSVPEDILIVHCLNVLVAVPSSTFLFHIVSETKWELGILFVFKTLAKTCFLKIFKILRMRGKKM